MSLNVTQGCSTVTLTTLELPSNVPRSFLIEAVFQRFPESGQFTVGNGVLPLNKIVYCSELPNYYETSVIIPGSNKGPPTSHFDWMALGSVSRSNCQSSECLSVGPSNVTVYMFGGSSVV
ncbi:hypothetical protein CHS0354_016682 [Potamilus streckersoni]|uniref:Uncharacterized protein n=1 Tax=Potamilus streckersoni TaxID=2493646 RepID=A0AAE0TIZ2_9BIVA|nr:hypothetical protein CHS0354_016682 [Potamilus streckersoni]